MTHRVPHPPNRGDRIRSYHMLRCLAARVEVDLACLSDEAVPDESRQELTGLCRRLAIIRQGRAVRWARAAGSFLRGRSATEGLFESRPLAMLLRQWADETRYDHVLAYCSSMGQYVSAGPLKQRPCVVDLVDVDSQKWLDYAARARGPFRWLYRAEARRVRSLEQELCHHAKAVTVVSAAEGRILRGFCPDARVKVVPNGVELDYFAPESARSGGETGESASQRMECLFVGALDYLPNIDGVTWFSREVWPTVHARFPMARFVVVGRRPARCIRQLSRQPGIDVIGEVSDVRPHLHRATLVVVPLRIARGIQNKVLEALAARKAVVASPAAMEGLNAEPGRHIYKADAQQEWVDCIGLLLEDPSSCRRLGTAGRGFATQFHQWDACLSPLEELLGVAAVREPAASSVMAPVSA